LAVQSVVTNSEYFGDMEPTDIKGHLFDANKTEFSNFDGVSEPPLLPFKRLSAYFNLVVNNSDSLSHTYNHFPYLFQFITIYTNHYIRVHSRTTTTTAIKGTQKESNQYGKSI
jgi:hypothetical protein